MVRADRSNRVVRKRHQLQAAHRHRRSAPGTKALSSPFLSSANPQARLSGLNTPPALISVGIHLDAASTKAQVHPWHAPQNHSGAPPACTNRAKSTYPRYSTTMEPFSRFEDLSSGPTCTGLCRRDAGHDRDRATQIDHSMGFKYSFGGSEVGPCKQAQTQIGWWSRSMAYKGCLQAKSDVMVAATDPRPSPSALAQRLEQSRHRGVRWHRPRWSMKPAGAGLHDTACCCAAFQANDQIAQAFAARDLCMSHADGNGSRR